GIQKIFYRLRITNKDGKWDYSKTIALENKSEGKNFIYPSIITNNVINCFIPDAYDYLQAFGMNGSLLLKKDIRGITWRVDVPIANLSKGIYMVKISNSNGNITQKIVVH
ncbi:MAG: T9SS type A sorting domain-containing protein, partial [Chitinophagaceae bacterium]